MLHIVLYEPEIPPNTGNVMRLAANTGAMLHLVKPLGFTLRDKTLERAGMDYRERAATRVHDSWGECRASLGEGPYYAVTTRGTRRYDEVSYGEDDVLVFGPETRGLPDDVLASFPPSHRLRIPMVPGSRSLNLSNAVTVVVYEAWRQLSFAILPGQE
ncbi:MAG TPA: tRNA (cytidine(34)-2'-O)-methyltransferase [Burkholderiales bacterium]|nr:tRNA (cytidine(34)-2'-O)-methyltransferase [Burkholderiales bacterium]